MNTSKLLAWNNQAPLREKILRRVRAHQKADEIIAGQYWDGHKGCSAGCALHSGSPHSVCEAEIGFPRPLFRLNDRLFESIHVFTPELAKAWPRRFYSAAKVGADLALVWPKFARWMLVDPETGVIRHAKHEQARNAIENVAALFEQWIKTGVRPDLYSTHASSVAASAAAAVAAADADAAAVAIAAAAAVAAADADAAAVAAADADAAAVAIAAERREFYLQHGYWPHYWWYRSGWGVKYKVGQDRYLAMADKVIELMKEA